MSKINDNQVSFTGESGKEYVFTEIYPMDTDYPKSAGIYVFTERFLKEGNYWHKAKYFGMTECFEDRFANHHKIEDATKRGANAICLMIVTGISERTKFEKDLIKGCNPICNDQHTT